MLKKETLTAADFSLLYSQLLAYVSYKTHRSLKGVSIDQLRDTLDGVLTTACCEQLIGCLNDLSYIAFTPKNEFNNVMKDVLTKINQLVKDINSQC